MSKMRQEVKYTMTIKKDYSYAILEKKKNQKTFSIEVILHGDFQKKAISHIFMNCTIKPYTLLSIPVLIWNL